MPVTTAPDVTKSAERHVFDVLVASSLSMSMRSKLPSKMGMFGGTEPANGHSSAAGMGSPASRPGSRNGRGVLVFTPQNSPKLLLVGCVTVSEETLTRMYSYFSSSALRLAAAGVNMASVSGAGSGLPEERIVVVGLVISVAVFGSVGVTGSSLVAEMNSATLPVTRTESPTVMAAPGAELVKTNIASDVFGSASATGSCMK